MKSTWRLFINIGFFSWNQPEAWNQPERDEINRNKKQVIFSIGRHCIGWKFRVSCSMWLTSNHMFFGWFWEKINRRFLTNFWNHPRSARGDFKILLILFQITLKNMWLLVHTVHIVWTSGFSYILISVLKRKIVTGYKTPGYKPNTPHSRLQSPLKKL